jgi:hypothetical protein
MEESRVCIRRWILPISCKAPSASTLGIRQKGGCMMSQSSMYCIAIGCPARLLQLLFSSLLLLWQMAGLRLSIHLSDQMINLSPFPTMQWLLLSTFLRPHCRPDQARSGPVFSNQRQLIRSGFLTPRTEWVCRLDSMQQGVWLTSAMGARAGPSWAQCAVATSSCLVLSLIGNKLIQILNLLTLIFNRREYNFHFPGWFQVQKNS